MFIRETTKEAVQLSFWTMNIIMFKIWPKTKLSSLQWFEFLWQIPFVNIALFLPPKHGRVGGGWKGFLWHKYPFFIRCQGKNWPPQCIGCLPSTYMGSFTYYVIADRGDLSEWLQYYIGVFRKMITVYHESWEYYVHRLDKKIRLLF